MDLRYKEAAAMRMVDVIAKKRHGEKLSPEEISFFVTGYTEGRIPDYQASALAMAVCFAGMDEEETAALTMAMAESGEMVDLSSIKGIKVDKHSTGGVGDKTTLIVAPIVASLGVPVAKMSGRGLGHTGGTVDKLEAIPGYRTTLSRQEFLDCVHKAGIAVAGQSGNLAPADKMLYALRDSTATVDSIPLIVSSIMSKKIAAGADAIVLDVKVGSGAFLKTLEEARILAREMVSIGESVGRSTVALLTAMDVPLGNAVGNALEVREALEVLRGRGPTDLSLLCVELAANMLLLAGKGELADCRAMAMQSLQDGTALEKFGDLVEVQGGDRSYVEHPDQFPSPEYTAVFAARRDGVITHMDAEGIGRASMVLGAGRRDKDDAIDHRAGIVLLRKTGDAVEKGEPVARLFASDETKLEAAAEILEEALTLGDTKPQSTSVLYGRIAMENGRIVEEIPEK